MEQKNPDFYEMRAIELVAEARNITDSYNTDHGKTIYNEKICKAISLLTLARAMRMGL